MIFGMEVRDAECIEPVARALYEAATESGMPDDFDKERSDFKSDLFRIAEEAVQKAQVRSWQ